MRITLLLLALLPCSIFAQIEGVLQMNDDVHQFLMRQQANGLLPEAFLSTQPLSAKEANVYLDSLVLHQDALSSVDQALLAQYRGTSNAFPTTRRFKKLYPDKYNFSEIKGKDYALQINPYLNLSFGPGKVTDFGGANDHTIWKNYRGIQMSGHIGNRLSFMSRISTNRVNLAFLASSRNEAERVGNTGGLQTTNNNYTLGYYQTAASLVYTTPHIEVRLGHDVNRWGHGINSVQLSNYAPEYDHLQLKTTLGKFQYTNLFTSFNDFENAANGQPYPKRYGAFHRLNYKPNRKLEFDVFESIIFQTNTDTGRKGYDFTYLNPLIFLRAAEHDRGSPDNALVGAGFSYIPTNKIKTYGQLLLDEFTFAEIKANRGYWANKWGILGGFYTTLIPKTDLRVEWAKVRPYTYSHFNSGTAFVHNGSILGHQGGPNSKNLSIFLQYQPSVKLRANIDLTYRDRGLNRSTENWGADARIPYTNRVQDLGNVTTQGNRETSTLIESRISYQWLPQLYLEAGIVSEQLKNADKGEQKLFLPFAQLRWGIPYRSQRY